MVARVVGAGCPCGKSYSFVSCLLGGARISCGVVGSVFGRFSFVSRVGSRMCCGVLGASGQGQANIC